MARISKEDAVRLLGDVPEEYAFWCCDGRIFRNTGDLYAGFSSMTDESFDFHANVNKHDFSNWVKDVIKDNKLARDLSNSVNRAQAAESVAERVNFLFGKLA
jgi:hypothetical protein